MPIGLTAAEPLRFCDDTVAYARAVEAFTANRGRGAFPLLSLSPFLAGVPRSALDAACEPGVPAREGRLDPHRICLALDEPFTRAAGACLATATDRPLRVISRTAFESELAAALAQRGLASVAIVLPSWDDLGRATPAWYRRALQTCRRLSHHLASVSWGLVTAASEASLSRLILKSALHREIAAAYANYPAGIFSTFEEGEGALPCFPPEPNARGLVAIDRRHVASGAARQVAARPWSFLLFKGHGRGYCGVEGYLCGARAERSDPEAAISSCVGGMQCLSPKYAQIDPRGYDAPVVAIDCCGGGSWASANWDSGVPSVAFLALAGSASAVLASDGVTMGPEEDTLDMLRAVGSSATLGEAARLLNEARSSAAAEAPYVLLGDPEVCSGSVRWPGWLAPAAPNVRTDGTLEIRLTGARGQVDVARLSSLGADEALFAKVVAIGPSPFAVRAFRVGDAADVWFARATGEATVQLEHGALPQLPLGLLEAAVEIEARLLPFQPPLEPIKPALRRAAEIVIKAGRRLQEAERRVFVGRRDDLVSLVSAAIGFWRAAHEAGLRQVIETASPLGLWPFRLWSVYGFETQEIDESCDYCGLPRILRRRYSSFPLRLREQRECMRCDLISDTPAAEGPTIAVAAPDSIGPNETVSIHITIDNRRGAAHLVGAVSMIVDGRGHGTKTTPGHQTVDIAPGDVDTLRFRLSVEDVEFVGHRYRLRGLLFANGQWWLGSRGLVLCARPNPLPLSHLTN
jgi:hypothetical protein